MRRWHTVIRPTEGQRPHLVDVDAPQVEALGVVAQHSLHHAPAPLCRPLAELQQGCAGDQLEVLALGEDAHSPAGGKQTFKI